MIKSNEKNAWFDSKMPSILVHAFIVFLIAGDVFIANLVVAFLARAIEQVILTELLLARMTASR